MRVLIVDATEIGRETLRRQVEAAGHEVGAAVASGAEALEALDRDADTLALVDVALHGEDGAALIAQLRAASPKLSVVGLAEGVEHQRRALEQGARGLLSKPVSAAELRRVAAELSAR